MARPQRYAHPVGIYRTAWGTWFVQLRHKGELLYLGTADTVEGAVEMRDAFRQQRAANPEVGRSMQAGGSSPAVENAS